MLKQKKLLAGKILEDAGHCCACYAWYLNIAKDYQVGQYPLHVLNVYISYGVTLGNSIDGTYAINVCITKSLLI